jgi:hypothetical protein
MSRAGGETSKCVICGSTGRVEANHVGGRRHIAWFTMPLCGEHHDRFHVLLNQIRLDLRCTPDPVERSLRVLKATLVFGWMVIEALHHQIAKQNGRCAAHDRDA